MKFDWTGISELKIVWVRRAKRVFISKAKKQLGATWRPADNFHIRAYADSETYVVNIWLRERNWRIEGKSWDSIVEIFLLRIEYPRIMQGEVNSSDPLDISSVVQKAAVQGLLYRVDNYPRFRIMKAKPPKRNPDCDAITDELARKLGVSEELERWHWSSEKTGAQTINKLHKLVDSKHEEEPCDDEDWFVNLIVMLHGHPHKNGKIIREKAMTLEDAPNELVVRDSSAGYDPPGGARGSNKKENAAAAIGGVMQAITRPLPPLVYATQSKGNEFLPIEKDQRKIFCESTLQNVTLQMVFGQVVYRPRNLYNGSAQNLSMGGNTGLQFVQLLTPELEWGKKGTLQEAKKILGGADSCAESDKKSWEYLVSFNSKLQVSAELLLVTEFEKYMYQPLEASLASFLCPLVAMVGNRVIAAPNFMPSGSFLTLFGNTELHRAQVVAFRTFVIKNNYKLPKLDGIRYQERISADPMDTTPEMLDIWFRSVLLQGDDFISRNIYGSYYDKWVDLVFGTKTKGGSGDYTQVRFLQRHVNWEGPLPRLVYDQKRAAIKICAPRNDMADLASAIKSIALSVGPHPWLPTLKEAYEKCRVDFGSMINDSYGARCGDNILNPEDMKRFWSPNHQVMRDTGTMRSLSKYGMHPEVAERALILPTRLRP